MQAGPSGAGLLRFLGVIASRCGAVANGEQCIRGIAPLRFCCGWGKFRGMGSMASTGQADFHPTDWVVITGPPSSGKTTLVQSLKSAGHAVSPDSTRALLAEVAAEGRRPEEFRFADDFQPRTLAAMEASEARLDPTHRTYLEYALPCNIAFHRTESLPLTPGLAEAARRWRYRSVFILDPLPWEGDSLRVEDETYQREVHRHMHDVYVEHGYTPHAVPVLSIPDRLAFVLGKVQELPDLGPDLHINGQD